MDRPHEINVVDEVKIFKDEGDCVEFQKKSVDILNDEKVDLLRDLALLHKNVVENIRTFTSLFPSLVEPSLLSGKWSPWTGASSSTSLLCERSVVATSSSEVFAAVPPEKISSFLVPPPATPSSTSSASSSSVAFISSNSCQPPPQGDGNHSKLTVLSESNPSGPQDTGTAAAAAYKWASSMQPSPPRPAPIRETPSADNSNLLLSLASLLHLQQQQQQQQHHNSQSSPAQEYFHILHQNSRSPSAAVTNNPFLPPNLQGPTVSLLTPEAASSRLLAAALAAAASSKARSTPQNTNGMFNHHMTPTSYQHLVEALSSSCSTSNLTTTTTVPTLHSPSVPPPHHSHGEVVKVSQTTAPDSTSSNTYLDTESNHSSSHNGMPANRSESGGCRGPATQHIKKPLNAFMLFMKDMRAQVQEECTLKESAAINQILGKKWHELPREKQCEYYERANVEKLRHQEMHPGWSARDNYACRSHRRNKRKKSGQVLKDSGKPVEDVDESRKKLWSSSSTPVLQSAACGEHLLGLTQLPSSSSSAKKCRARWGIEQQDRWCRPCRRKKKCIRFVEESCEAPVSPGSALLPTGLTTSSMTTNTVLQIPSISSSSGESPVFSREDNGLEKKCSADTHPHEEEPTLWT